MIVSPENLDEALSGAQSTKLRRDMKKGVVSFSYKKSNGEIRRAKGTLKKSELPKFAEDRPARHNARNFVYWDTEKDEFRCFARDNFIGVDGENTEGSKSAKRLDESNPSNWIVVTDISPKRAKWLLSHSQHNVDNFEPGYVAKALRSKPSANCIWGLFNRYDRKNALALATVIRDYGPESGCVYLHEMTGFMKGGAGRTLVRRMLGIFPKAWLQCSPIMRGGKSEINTGLADGVYRKIPELKEYTVADSIWKGPANFFYSGIDDAVMAKFLEDSYGAVKTENH